MPAFVHQFLLLTWEGPLEQDERAERQKLESERTQLEAQSAAFRDEIQNLRQELESSKWLAASLPADDQIRLPA